MPSAPGGWSWTDLGEIKTGNTLKRWNIAVKYRAFDSIRDLALIKTPTEEFLETLRNGNFSTKAFWRRIHNFALDMDWIPNAIISKRQWSKIRFNAKRAITLLENQSILTKQKNPEYYAYYELLWHLEGSQNDIANLYAENVNWSPDHRISPVENRQPLDVAFWQFSRGNFKSVAETGAIVSPNH